MGKTEKQNVGEAESAAGAPLLPDAGSLLISSLGGSFGRRRWRARRGCDRESPRGGGMVMSRGGNGWVARRWRRGLARGLRRHEGCQALKMADGKHIQFRQPGVQVEVGKEATELSSSLRTSDRNRRWKSNNGVV